VLCLCLFRNKVGTIPVSKMPQIDTTPSPQCVALFDNVADTPDELAFRNGDVMQIVEQDIPASPGWMLCILRGRQGLCPKNRVRILTETDQLLQREGRRRSWNLQPNKVVTPQKYGDVYLYDMPSNAAVEPLAHYDVPPTSHQAVGGVVTEERYDVPKAVASSGAITPSSSLSSLTTDSNRSSLIQQDYDIPRPLPQQKTVPMESQKLQPSISVHLSPLPRNNEGQDLSPLGEHCGSQQTYDVPKSENVILDMTRALDWLVRLESEASAAISHLLAYAVPNWRTLPRLEPRLQDIRQSTIKLRASLNQLVVFTTSIHSSIKDRGLKMKMAPLLEAVRKGSSTVGECFEMIERKGWSCETLGQPEYSPDSLDEIISSAAMLTDDIRQLASFIQGNSTLLFKRGEPQGEAADDSYVNVDSKEKDEEGSISSPQPPQCTLVINKEDIEVLLFYAGQYKTYYTKLTDAIDGLLGTVTNNQPPKVFLSHCKCVILSGEQLLLLGDTAERYITSKDLKRELLHCTQIFAKALAGTVSKTKTAATNFPSVTAVQNMVDSVVDLSHRANHLKRALIEHSNMVSVSA